MPYERLLREGHIRRKRNRVDYTGVGHISMTEAEDLLKEVGEFAAQAQAWIQTHHPELQENESQL